MVRQRLNLRRGECFRDAVLWKLANVKRRISGLRGKCSLASATDSQVTTTTPPGQGKNRTPRNKSSRATHFAELLVDGVMAPFTPPLDGIIYVQKTYSGPNSDGTLAAPFKTVTAGYNAATNSNTIRIFNGNYNEAGIMNKTLLLQATNGVVNIGVP